MITDKNLQFASAQSIASAVGDVVSTNILDTQAAQDEGIGNGRFKFVWDITTIPTSAGAATIQFVIQTSADNSTWVDAALSPAYAYNAAPVNAVGQACVQSLEAGLRRYIRTAVRIGGATTTAGAVNSYAVLDAQRYQFGASGFFVG